MISHWWLYGRKWPSPASPKNWIRFPQYRGSPRNLKFSQPLATRYEKNFLASHKKNVWVGGEYTMENRDTNTNYQKVVRVWDQKWEIVEITIGITVLFEILLHYIYFLYRDFSSPTWKKSSPPKVPIPTQNLNLTYVSPI